MVIIGTKVAHAFRFANRGILTCYMLGNTIDDNYYNRLIWIGNDSGIIPVDVQLVYAFSVSNWNATNSSSGASDAEYIRFRAGGGQNDRWGAGTYLLAVK